MEASGQIMCVQVSRWELRWGIFGQNHTNRFVPPTIILTHIKQTLRIIHHQNLKLN
jgi:hypothetical protein